LRDYYPKLSDAERNEQEEFVVDACWHMRDRFNIVPTVRDIGLWGPRVQQAFMAMAAIEFAIVDAATLLDNDARVADEFDARLGVRVAMPQ
jgi:hypothetical protein